MSESRSQVCAVWLILVAAFVTRVAFGGEPDDERTDSGSTRLAMAPTRTRVAMLPGDVELESRGARIGHIAVRVDEVFEHADADSKSLAAPYRVANGLHVSTREATVYAQLLFRSGDPFSRRVLDETERYLRSQRYLNDATVEPVRYNDDNTVDLEVRVHDVWTLSPGVSFGRKGGSNHLRFEIEDTNLFGLGKLIEVAHSDDVDRSAWLLKYHDPHIAGSWWQMTANFADSSDGGEKVLSIARPFYSLDSRWSLGGTVADSETIVSRYAFGNIFDQFQMHRRAFDLGGGISSGLQDGWTRRYLGGIRYEDREFSVFDVAPRAGIPENRTDSYPWVGVEWIQDEYVKTRNLNQIGRTEDLYLGRSARLEAGVASTALGSTYDALVLRAALHHGVQLSDRQYWINSLTASGRLDSDRVSNGIFDVATKLYWRLSPRSVLFAAANATLTENLDEEDQLVLGGDNGLRGYPLRYQAGDMRALFTLEQRFYSEWQPLKLINVGAAVFFDAGRTWGRDVVAPPSVGWLKDAGLGLRLGSPRSGLGNVLHIDIAFPLDGPDTIDSMQFLIETRRSF